MQSPYLVQLTGGALSPPRVRQFFSRGDSRTSSSQTIGNKALGLQALMRLGVPVPLTYVCRSGAHQQFRQGDPHLAEQLKAELAAVIRPGLRYAVRSSANLEDDPRHSFAGQFKSILDVEGVESIWQAMCEVWASAGALAATAYLARTSRAPDELKMAVLVQEMVRPEISGVAFSRNPLTGMDEVVVEAVTGSGEALVQEGVTPERWVHKWGDWIVRPEHSSLPLPVIRDVVAQTRHIARACGQPLDLEWVYDGAALVWVQMRAITSLMAVDIYSDKIAREVLPGQIKPLVWSVNVPLVNGAWVRLFTELIGPNDIDPNSLARAFFYRAYFNMGAIGRIFETLGMPRDSLELLMGIDGGDDDKPSMKPTARAYRYAPRLLRAAGGKLRFARQVEAFLPAMEAQYRAFRRDGLEQLGEQTLLAEIDKLYSLSAQTAYFNIVVPLLMGLYNRLLARQLARCGVDASQVDVAQGLEALRDLDPNLHLARLNEKFAALAAADAASLAPGGPCCNGSCPPWQPSDGPAALAAVGEPGTMPSPAWQDFQGEFDDFVRRFGHFGDNGNDFSTVPWRENRELVLKMVANSRPAPNGAASGQPLPGQPAHRKLSFEELALPPLRRPLLSVLYRRARAFRLYREQISSLYTFGYGLFRDYFLALGSHFARRGIIAAREDIFYLYLDEVRQIVAGSSTAYAGEVATRRQEMDACRDAVLPAIIYGNQPPPLDSPAAIKLAGTPTSRGYYQGPVRVVRGLYELDKLQTGDVLVIPFSDVGWTPLFARASAVIAESGGILSHSSIVAREYGIPAVVSVPGACSLQDGAIVTVDGYSGKIALQE